MFDLTIHSIAQFIGHLYVKFGAYISVNFCDQCSNLPAPNVTSRGGLKSHGMKQKISYAPATNVTKHLKTEQPLQFFMVHTEVGQLLGLKSQGI